MIIEIIIAPFAIIFAFMGCYIIKKMIDTYMKKEGDYLIQSKIEKRNDNKASKEKNIINYPAGRRQS